MLLGKTARLRHSPYVGVLHDIRHIRFTINYVDFEHLLTASLYSVFSVRNDLSDMVGRHITQIGFDVSMI